MAGKYNEKYRPQKVLNDRKGETLKK